MKKNTYVLALVSAAACGLLLLLTSPQTAQPIIFIAVFLSLFSSLYFGLQSILRMFAGYRSRSSRRQGLIAGSVSGLITVGLILQSIGQLTVRDVLTLLLFCVLLYFYGNKMLQRK